MTIFIGNNDNENLTGSTGDDQISGNGGNDVLIGYSGNDTLTGGLGNDSLQGNAGADIYLIAKTDNQDVIYNWDADSSIDTVKFTNLPSTGITAVFGLNNDLVLQYGIGGQLTVNNYFYTDANYRIDKFQFTDKEWTLAQLASQHKGTINADSLIGFNGVVNVITALDGNDSLYGGDMNDTLNGGDGNDSFYSYAGDDQLLGGNGDDGMQAGDGKDSLDGGDGNDVLWAGEGADTIIGGAGNDNLEGDGGDDVLTGGLGNDSLQGNAGADIYLIAKTDNQDIIYNWDADSSIDTVKFTNLPSTGITAVFGLNNDLVLQYGIGGQLTVNNYFYTDANYRIDKFQFTDKEWTLAQLASQHKGTINADSLIGFNGVVNVITALDGNDSLYGGDMNDTLNGGDGNDSFYSYAGDDQLLGGNGDDGMQAGDGKDSLDGGDGNDVLWAGEGADTIIGGAGNDNLEGDGGDDVLTGGLGNDSLQGNAGADIYLIAKTDNQDIIYNWDADSSIDTVKFTNLPSTGITAVFGLNNDLVLQYGIGGQLTVNNYFYTDANYRIDKFQFTDKEWTLAQLASQHKGTINADSLIGFNGVVNVITALDGNDSLYGGDMNDTLNGGDGNDSFYSYAGDDQLLGGNGDDGMQAGDGKDSLDGGDGNDVLWAGEGADTIIGGAGNDNLEGDGGDDVLTGGLGNDSLQGNAGADIYLIAKTDNQDIIYNWDADSSIDTVKFTNLPSTGITAVFGLNNDLVLQYGIGGQLTVNNYFYTDANYRIDKFQFTDKEWTLAQLASQHKGTINADSLIGFNGVVNVITALDGNDSLYGGDMNDTLNGGDGNDSFYSYAGDDQLLGGNGDDGMQAGDGKDSLDGGDGNDVLWAGEGADTIIGGAGNDNLEGDGGDDVLTGGLGNDSLQGNAGADIYLIAKTDNQDIIYNWDADNSVDIVKLTDVTRLDLTGISSASGDINSLVLSYGNVGSQITVNNYFYNVSYRINEVQLMGNDSLQNFIVGSVANDTLIGTDGNDAISGQAGVDVMNGGLGNDLYFVDNTADSVIENGRSGIDTVLTSANYTLSNNVENLALLAGASNGTGNGMDNQLTGNAASNTLRGLAGDDVLDGGLKGDQLEGGEGNDTYLVDNIADTVLEAENQGLDSVQSSVSFTLAANVENLLLTKDSAINGTGNEMNNTLIGNTAVNILEGGAGNDLLDGAAGADVLKGGTGDDTYLVDAIDTVLENVDAGTDTVTASLSYSLSDNVENLILMGDAAINATGNDLANSLTGNSANNILNGGSGADVLQGKAGDDTYFVDNIGDRVEENSGEGIDTVKSTIDYTLTSNVENLVLIGSAVKGTGDARVNSLTGNAGDNILDGGADADRLAGGAGNDTYLVDNIGDQVIEDTNGGIDTIQTAMNYTLVDNIENLTLTGTAALKGSGNDLANVLIGNSGHNILDGGKASDTMKGGEGDDTYLVNITTDVVEENANQGIDTVSSMATYTLSDNVENLILTGSAAIDATGNALANHLTGNSANNILNGGLGADVMQGQAGDDTYFVDDAGDRIDENSGEGVDTVQSSINYTLPTHLEKLVLIGTAVNGTGNDSANSVVGNAGDNVLDGGADADSLAGGAGNDTYLVDNISDQIAEDSNAGLDNVQSSVNYTLADNVENLTLIGKANLKGTGNDLANSLLGNSGNNILNGGKESDTMKGGEGDDTYLVNVTTDVVEENANQGIDTVSSTATYTLSDNVENLILTGSAAIDATGNALANNLTGNSANNILNGGLGADVMQGQAGDDTYFVDDAGDRIDENSGEGVDTVQSSINYTLPTHLEKLVLIGAAVNGTGNDRANSLVGNASDNVLDGGADADSLAGGAGNDTYLVDNSGDQIIEDSNSGIDNVQSSVNYTLADNVENLTLTGKASLKGTGNDLANSLLGNSGNNVLNGGKESDTMIGGEGNDTYLVNVATDVVVENANQGNDTVSSTVTYTLGDNVENLLLTGSSVADGIGNALNNTLTGNAGSNRLDGAVGADTLTGGSGVDVFVFDTLVGGTDTTLDVLSGVDKVQIGGDISIGNGDATIDAGIVIDQPSGFSAQAELVISSSKINGFIDRAAAATAIGSANSAFSIGDTRLFVVTNNVDSVLYQFTSVDTNAEVNAAELTLIGTLQGTAQTVLADYLFV